MEVIKGSFCTKMGTIKNRNGRDLVDAEEIKKKYMENCTEKILINWITKMVWSATQSQTFWSVKSSGP